MILSIRDAQVFSVDAGVLCGGPGGAKKRIINSFSMDSRTETNGRKYFDITKGGYCQSCVFSDVFGLHLSSR